jgi:RHS repeat-associated protein
VNVKSPTTWAVSIVFGMDVIYEKSHVDGQADQMTTYVIANGMRIAKITSSGVQYYLPDHLGSTQKVLDASRNTVFSTDYEPFGKPVAPSGSESYKFTSEKHDDPTGLVYLRARQYDPEIGRFVSADPVLGSLSRPQTLNRYAYVSNNPLSRIDPTGLYDCGYAGSPDPVNHPSPCDQWWRWHGYWDAVAQDPWFVPDFLMTIVGFIPVLDTVSDVYFLARDLYVGFTTGQWDALQLGLDIAAVGAIGFGIAATRVPRLLNRLDDAAEVGRFVDTFEGYDNAKKITRLARKGDPPSLGVLRAANRLGPEKVESFAHPFGKIGGPDIRLRLGVGGMIDPRARWIEVTGTHSRRRDAKRLSFRVRIRGGGLLRHARGHTIHSSLSNRVHLVASVTMSVGVSVYVIPPEPRIQAVLTELAVGLVKLGWKQGWTFLGRGDSRLEREQGSLADIQGSHPVVVDFAKDTRALELQVGQLREPVIALASDVSFFRDSNALMEFKAIFGNVTLPSETLVVGHFTHWLERCLDRYSVRGLVSSTRLRERGLFWIDQFGAEQWNVVQEAYPEMRHRVLAKIGSTRVAMIVDNPFDEEGEVLNRFSDIVDKLAIA